MRISTVSIWMILVSLYFYIENILALRHSIRQLQLYSWSCDNENHLSRQKALILYYLSEFHNSDLAPHHYNM